MKQPDPIPASCESPLPACLLSRLAGLPEMFTRPTWQNVLLLVAGAILAPSKRTVTAALRILGRGQETDFPIYHGDAPAHGIPLHSLDGVGQAVSPAPRSAAATPAPA